MTNELVRTKRLGVIRLNNKYSLLLSLTSELQDIGCEDGETVSIIGTKDGRIIIEKLKA